MILRKWGRPITHIITTHSLNHFVHCGPRLQLSHLVFCVLCEINFVCWFPLQPPGSQAKVQLTNPPNLSLLLQDPSTAAEEVEDVTPACTLTKSQLNRRKKWEQERKKKLEKVSIHLGGVSVHSTQPCRQLIYHVSIRCTCGTPNTLACALFYMMLPSDWRLRLWWRSSRPLPLPQPPPHPPLPQPPPHPTQRPLPHLCTILHHCVT